MPRYVPGIRAKLVTIFILIKVLPLIALAWFAWEEIFNLSSDVEERSIRMIENTHEVVGGISELSTENSIQALDIKSREAIERLTTDTARTVAAFLYDRDHDIQLASRVPVDELQYRRFLESRLRPVTLHAPWTFDEQSDRWLPAQPDDAADAPEVSATNDDNRRDFHYRAPDRGMMTENRPLYLEMTFVDLEGNEMVKVGTSDRLPKDRTNVADPMNTYCRAETYFSALQQLAPGDIYVSEMIGPYVKGHIIGTYNHQAAEKRGIPFEPEASGYAGKENPVGIRFQGLIRWATPVIEAGRTIGYVTLALDHTHLMEFTDHIVPTDARYSAISDAGSGNYAFMWDFKGRNISHPRDYFITGYDPETGQPATPWLDEEMMTIWQQVDGAMPEFIARAPRFKEQSLEKRPAAALTRAGMVGLDCRYLNFAPQCTGWHTLTQHGGSGSFLIFWSGLWKLTTAAAIPYHTGIYSEHPRGFGFVTIGANVDEFHRSAVETADTIHAIEKDYIAKLNRDKRENQQLMRASLKRAFQHLTFYTALMIVFVIMIAIFMAANLTARITSIIQGIRRFQKGDRSYRLPMQSSDEMGQLVEAYNEMADDVEHTIGDIERSKVELEAVNARLESEINERRLAQNQLAEHRDNLEEMVGERTQELEKEIVERKRMEKIQQESESRLREENQTLMLLAGNDAIYSGDPDEAMGIIIPAAAKTLKADRCSIWLKDESQIWAIRRHTYVVDEHRPEAEPERFRLADYPIYFETFKKSRTLVAADVEHDDRLVEMNKTLLPPLGIRSMMSSTVYEGGEMVGVITFSHIGAVHQWHLDEINFASSIADIIGLSLDAARRKQTVEEKEALAARLRRAEKMEAIGTLAGGVAHDLNNILSGIVSYPELLLHQLPPDSNLREPVKTIYKSGKRAATIVQDLLTLARRGVAIDEVINLNQIVEEYLKSPEHGKLLTYHPHIRISTRTDPDLMNISGSSVHLSKTLMNLMSNAAESMIRAGEISIVTENCYIDKPIKGYDIVKEGDYVALTVQDTGEGIAPEDLNRIFEPFYTKKKMGRSGTGLGMAVVWGTVQDHRGYIDYESREGEGSRFTLYFPVTRKAKGEDHHPALQAYTGNGETILVVDDVAEQREIAEAILTTLGYQVKSVPSGEAAIERLKNGPVDLLVLDMIMDPGMDGLDTYRRALKVHPGQKAIIASGFSETERIREVLRLGAASYLKKPYTIENIGTAVKAALERG